MFQYFTIYSIVIFANFMFYNLFALKLWKKEIAVDSLPIRLKS